MTKPAIKTISYVVYPPNYNPGDGYAVARSMTEAKSICRKKAFGNGSEVVRTVYTRNRKGNGITYSPFRNLGKNGMRFDEFVYNPRT